MQSAEIELKFPVPDPAAFLQRVAELGLHLETPRTFESNTLYDASNRPLLEKRQILRIRRYGDRWVVTHKRMPEGNDTPERYKTRIETETVVEDGTALGLIFEQLGYYPAFRYEKYRTEWSDGESGEGHLVMDETAIGNFAELEGSPAWIDRMLERLGIDPSQCMTESYGKLFLAWKARTGSPAENLTFDEIGAFSAAV